jgi:hypothetical protein
VAIQSALATRRRAPPTEIPETNSEGDVRDQGWFPARLWHCFRSQPATKSGLSDARGESQETILRFLKAGMSRLPPPPNPNSMISRLP